MKSTTTNLSIFWLSFIALISVQCSNVSTVKDELTQTRSFVPEIILVNIGNLDRSGIARQLEILNKYNPKVIGIDAFFRKPKRSDSPTEDSILIAGDSALSRALKKIPNIVIGLELTEDSVKISHPMFRHKNIKMGFLNLVTGEGNKNRYIENCKLQIDISDSLANMNNIPSLALSLPMQLALFYNKPKALKALERKNTTEPIYFSGNINTANLDAKIQLQSFAALDVAQVLNEEFDPAFLENKIILMGYLGENFDSYSSEGRYWVRVDNFSQPEEMYGLVVQANVCAMILNEKFKK